jgi:hypothetical protein
MARLCAYLLINTVAITSWQTKFSLMKLYFGTLFEECAVNLANPEYSEGYGSSALRHWLTIQICAL